MIDIHCHLIPKLDDGPSSWDESLQMVEVAVSDGIRSAYATPHWIQGSTWCPRPDVVKEGVDELNRRIRSRGLEFTVWGGMEVALTHDIPELLQNGDILKLGGSEYILLEVPYISLPYGMTSLIDEVKSMGVVPVLAHPERNVDFQNKPEVIEEFVSLGALVQVTSSSFCGYFGTEAQECAIKFAEMDVISVLASDGHSPETRPPIISSGLAVVEEIVGESRAGDLVERTHSLFG